MDEGQRLFDVLRLVARFLVSIEALNLKLVSKKHRRVVSEFYFIYAAKLVPVLANFKEAYLLEHSRSAAF